VLGKGSALGTDVAPGPGGVFDAGVSCRAAELCADAELVVCGAGADCACGAQLHASSAATGTEKCLCVRIVEVWVRKEKTTGMLNAITRLRKGATP